MTKAHSPAGQLQQAKRRALGWLAAAFCAFVLALFLPPSGWQGALKACAEAALVGGLADWFAVSALFRRLPIPFLSAHTDVLRRNQAKVAENLGRFVREHFFSPAAIQSILAERDLAAQAAAWLKQAQNRAQLARHVQQALRVSLETLDDAPVQRLLLRSLEQALGQWDARPAVANLLGSMLRQGRHQALLDEVVSQLAAYLAQPQVHGHFAGALSTWLQREYPKLEKLLPTETLGDKGAKLLQKLLQDFFNDVHHNPQHFVRLEVQASAQRLQQSIAHDPLWQDRLQRFTHELASNPDIHAWVRGMAGDLRTWLLADLQAENSRLNTYAQNACLWLAQALEGDATLRSSLNQHLQKAVLHIAPDIGAFLQTHISRSLAQWDSRLMVAQIEQQIGPELQSIRINGTALGGCIGLLLWVLAQLAASVQSLH